MGFNSGFKGLMVIYIYRQIQQIDVLSNAQQCYTVRSIQSFSGVNVHYLKTNEIP